MASKNGITLQTVEARKTYVTDLCVSLINIEDYSSAVSEFKILGDESLLLGVVNGAYGRNISNIPKVIRFIKQLGNSRHEEIASEALLHLVKAGNNLKSLKLLYFSELSADRMSASLKTELEERKRGLIRSISYRYDPDLLPNALKLDENFPASDVTVKLTIYSELLDEMTENNDLDRVELLMLAYKTRGLQQVCEDNPVRYGPVKDRLSSFIARFPAGVRALFWNKLVYIESKQHSGYMLTAPDKEVWTYPKDFSQFQQWTMWPMEGGRYFEVEPMRTGHRLYAEGVLYDRKLFVGYHKGSESMWQVIPASNGKFFYFKNKMFGEALDANALVQGSKSSSKYLSRAYVHGMVKGNSYQLWSIH